jgi:zinc transport system permease protein
MGLAEILGYGFMQRALLAGCLIALPCAVLGVFLVLRRLSLIGDGLSHVTFGSVALAMFLNVYPLYVTIAAIPVVMLSSLGILKLTERARVLGDAAIGIVSSVGVAGGILLASLSGGFNIDLFSYLFGNILSVRPAEVWISLVLFLVVVISVLLFYHDLVSVTFNPELATTSGIRTERVSSVLVLLTALVVVLAMKVVGIMLVSALLILPAVSALQVARGFRTALLLASGFAVVSVVAGISSSFLLDLPAGATVILCNFLFFVAAFAFRRFRA